jgi:Site-specific recombinase XerD
MTTDVATGLSRATARLAASRSPGGPRARRSADGQPRFGCNLSRINWQTCAAHQSSDHKAVVLEVLGHTRVTTTERYTHVATLQMKDASERMGEAPWGQG